MDEVIEKGK
jgi:long-chain acyl-CoA synthetase